MIGKILNDRYEIIELIGRGGMAFVYKARDLKLNRFVAVKVLKEEYSENEQFIRKFERESQAAAGLSHPNIVSVYDVGVDHDVHFIVMELIDGITLKQYLDKKGVLDYSEATGYIIDIAEALSCAHANGIIHRDIKPQNIMMTKDLMPKVTDFGIARAVTSSTVTMTKETMGSVHYISPEQARGGFLDERSDLYSLGIMYYELVTGELPFDEDTTVTIAIKHIREEITPPIELNPHIPQSVNDVILKLTRKSPDERYQSADDLIEDLDEILLNPGATVGSVIQPSNPGVKQVSPNGEGLFQYERNTEMHPLLHDEDDEFDDFGGKSKKKKNKKLIIGGIAIGVAVIILGIVGYLFFSGKKEVQVPDLKGMTKEQATEALKALDLSLEVEKEVFSAEIEAGKIVTQNPSASSMIASGKTVKVTISKGTDSVRVPNVIGKSENEASEAIRAAKLTVGEIKREYNSDYASGTVFMTSPNIDEKVSEKTAITLYVSLGTELNVVPGIVGLLENDANARIQAQGFTVGTVTKKHNDSYNEGTVISQSPTEGSESPKGTPINYVVSLGKETKPEPPEPTPEPN